MPQSASSPNDVFIVSAARTPIGAFQGSLAGVAAPELGATAIRAALERAALEPSAVGEVWMGNVLSAGIGQAPTRQAAKRAGIPDDVPAAGVSKVCGSGLQAVILATKSLALGDIDTAIAGGMESMTQAPYLLPQGRSGYRMGNGQVIDSMVHDGLWDPYSNIHMGQAAELCAKKYDVTREAQDAFARQSYERAQAAQKSGAFDAEMAPVRIKSKGGEEQVVLDDEPGRARFDKIPELKPAFEKTGTITAANASKINDGGAALVLANARAIKERGLKPMARVVGYAAHAQAPEWFTTAPIGAIAKVLQRTGLKPHDIDLFEINEAFSVVSLVCAKESGADLSRTNVRGGAVALGHPIGASGARILTTLLYALRDLGKRRGLATLCIGGGEAVAMVVERCD